MHYKVKNQSYRLKAILKKCDFSLDLKMFKDGAALSSRGREFHAAGPACVKACSPNLVDSRGDEQFVVLAERSPGRSVCAAAVLTRSLR